MKLQCLATYLLFIYYRLFLCLSILCIFFLFSYISSFYLYILSSLTLSLFSLLPLKCLLSSYLFSPYLISMLYQLFTLFGCGISICFRFSFRQTLPLLFFSVCLHVCLRSQPICYAFLSSQSFNLFCFSTFIAQATFFTPHLSHSLSLSLSRTHSHEAYGATMSSAIKLYIS